MTFSFRPRRWSTAPWMEASVSTRVVSWNDAAEMNESVESDALVMPSSSGRPVAGLPPLAIAFSFSSRKRNLSICCSSRNDVSPTSSTFTQRIIWRTITSMCLSLMFTPCKPVDFLDFVHQVSLQLLFAQHGKNVVRVERAIHQRLAGANALAFLHVDVNAARHLVFLLGAVVGHDVDLALALGDVAELHHAIDLADDRGFVRLARFEQLLHARQTAGDVLGLGGLARDLRQHVAGRDRVAILHHQVSARRHQVTLAALGALDDDGRLALLVRRIDHHVTRQAGDFVHFFVQRQAFLQVLELHRAADFGEDREGVRIPLDQDIAERNLRHLLRP